MGIGRLCWRVSPVLVFLAVLTTVDRTFGSGPYADATPLVSASTVAVSASKAAVPVRMFVSDGINFLAQASVTSARQAFVTAADTGQPFTPMINGRLVTLQPVSPGLFEINLPVSSLNFGYGRDDDGPSSIAVVAPQMVTSFAGMATGMSSLAVFCASQNPITQLDLHGLPSLTDIECFQCQDLASINVTNCVRLKRACFEQCAVQGVLDLTRDVNLADLRAAANQFTNVVFGGAGPRIWHFCVRDNPQLQQLKLTSLSAVQELLMWNCNQAGSLTRATLPSLSLTDVEIANNSYQLADFRNERHLRILSAPVNNLTNVLLNGCVSLTNVDLGNNWLSPKALDSILAAVSTSTINHGGVLRLDNNGYPSAAGYAIAAALATRVNPAKRWVVYLDQPTVSPNAVIQGDGTNGGTGTITFVTLGRPGASSVTMHLDLKGMATVKWHWANGTTSIGAGNVARAFKDQAFVYHTNYVTVSPASAVVGFGKPDGYPDQGVCAISGIAQWPNLATLYLANDSLRTLSLAGCSPSLSQVHLEGNPASASTIDQWLVDLNAATTPTSDAQFFFPAAQTSASDAAVNDLIQKGFALFPL